VPDPTTCRSRPAPRRAGAAACPPPAADDVASAACRPSDPALDAVTAGTAGVSTDAGRPAGRGPSVRLATFRALAAVALGACLLLACCSGGATTPDPPTGPPPAASAEVRATAALAAAPPVRVRIPAIEVDSALVGLGLQADGTLQVPADGSVAGWFTGAPTPGERGPAVLAAHVDWDHAPGVFFRLHDLEPGDEVAVDRADGIMARFVVLGVEQYPKDAFPTERVYGDIDHAGLRLITCGGAFDRAARSYRDNVVVYAGLVGTAPGPRPA
jgi:sortase (surface protein transpeptidase)